MVFRKHFNIQEGGKVVVCAGLYFRRKGIEDFVEVARRMPDVRFIWLGSINKWIIPRKIRNLVLFNHPKNVEFPGYFKGAVFEGAMSGSSLFFSLAMKRRKESLCWKRWLVINTWFCEIFPYEGWIDEQSAELGA